MKLKAGVGTEQRINRWGYFFVLPFVLVYFAFNFYPTLYTFLLSFTDLKGLRSDFIFVGLQNFSKLIKDQYFWGAVKNTFIIWAINFAPQLGVALILSIWLSDIRLKLKGKSLFRAVIYMPNLLTAASVALLFRSLFAYPIGPVNQFLQQNLGIFREVVRDGVVVREAFNFFRDVTASRFIVAFIQWWMWYGHTVIMLMAGITSISTSLYESAVVDGANSRQTTWYITLPMLRPMMLYILVTSMIGGMQMFDIPFLLTDMRGGPDFKIRTTSVYLYNMAFQGRNDYAYAAAIAIGVFIITITLALLIFFFLQDRSDLKQHAKKVNTPKGGL
ncbi:MAG TPA: sugar ABC transporter permease [Treponemataceae bacterium]|nr:sugar ABC transporter permease [Treponemataceae bacterium]